MYIFKLVFSFSLDIYPGGELLDHRVVLFLEFWRNSILFSIGQHQLISPLIVGQCWSKGFLWALSCRWRSKLSLVGWLCNAWIDFITLLRLRLRCKSLLLLTADYWPGLSPPWYTVFESDLRVEEPLWTVGMKDEFWWNDFCPRSRLLLRHLLSCCLVANLCLTPLQPHGL